MISSTLQSVARFFLPRSSKPMPPSAQVAAWLVFAGTGVMSEKAGNMCMHVMRAALPPTPNPDQLDNVLSSRNPR